MLSCGKNNFNSRILKQIRACLKRVTQGHLYEREVWLGFSSSRRFNGSACRFCYAVLLG